MVSLSLKVPRPYGVKCWTFIQHYRQMFLSVCWHFPIVMVEVLEKVLEKIKCWHFCSIFSEVLEIIVLE